jgi:hypothetical protein
MWSDAGLAAATVAFPFIFEISFTPLWFSLAKRAPLPGHSAEFLYAICTL